MRNGTMNYLLIFIVPFFLYPVNSLSAQTTCDTVYSSSSIDELADFGIPQKEFQKFLNTKIIPLIGEEMNEYKTVIPSLNMLFTISDQGELIKIEFPELKSSKKLQEKLAQEFITLGKWKPATINGKPVCSEFGSAIGCIKWQ